VTLTGAGVQHEGCYKEQNLQLYLRRERGGGAGFLNTPQVWRMIQEILPSNCTVDYVTEKVQELPEISLPGTIMVQIQNN
jgi:hypothetical protein